MNDINVVTKQKSLYIINELNIYEMNYHKELDKDIIIKKFDITASTLNKVLTGNSDISIELYNKIIKYLGSLI